MAYVADQMNLDQHNDLRKYSHYAQKASTTTMQGRRTYSRSWSVIHILVMMTSSISVISLLNAFGGTNCDRYVGRQHAETYTWDPLLNNCQNFLAEAYLGIRRLTGNRRTSFEIRCAEHGGLKPLPDSTIVTMHAASAVTHMALILLCYGLQLPVDLAKFASFGILVVTVAPSGIARSRRLLEKWRLRRSGPIELV